MDAKKVLLGISIFVFTGLAQGAAESKCFFGTFQNAAKNCSDGDLVTNYGCDKLQELRCLPFKYSEKILQDERFIFLNQSASFFYNGGAGNHSFIVTKNASGDHVVYYSKRDNGQLSEDIHFWLGFLHRLSGTAIGGQAAHQINSRELVGLFVVPKSALVKESSYKSLIRVPRDPDLWSQESIEAYETYDFKTPREGFPAIIDMPIYRIKSDWYK